jgi:hypothetical protein
MQVPATPLQLKPRQQAVPTPVVLHMAAAWPQAQVPPLQVPKQQSVLVLHG